MTSLHPRRSWTIQRLASSQAAQLRQRIASLMPTQWVHYRCGASDTSWESSASTSRLRCARPSERFPPSTKEPDSRIALLCALRSLRRSHIQAHDSLLCMLYFAPANAGAVL